MYYQIQETLRHQRSISQKEIDAICEANALGRKNNLETSMGTEQIQALLVKRQLETIETAITEASKLDTELNESLQLLKKELQKELLEIQRRGFRNRLSDLEQDLEEQAAILQSQFTIGALNEIQFLEQKLEICQISLTAQLRLIAQYIAVINDEGFLQQLKEKEKQIFSKIKLIAANDAS